MADECVRIGRGCPLLSSSSDDPREGGGRSGDPSSSSGQVKLGPGEAPKAIFTASAARGFFALSRAAGSPGLRREGAACRRMTEEGAGHFIRIDELKRFGPLPAGSR